jgi:hypothetical protein
MGWWKAPLKAISSLATRGRISLALTIGTDNVLATTNRDLNAGGSIALNARSVGANRAEAKASVAGGDGTPDTANDGDNQGGGVSNQIHNQSKFASDRADKAGAESGTTADTDDKTAAETQGGSVQVAGAVGVTVTHATATAAIPDSRHQGRHCDRVTTARLAQVENTDLIAIADVSATPKARSTDPIQVRRGGVISPRRWASRTAFHRGRPDHPRGRGRDQPSRASPPERRQHLPSEAAARRDRETIPLPAGSTARPVSRVSSSATGWSTCILSTRRAATRLSPRCVHDG